MPLYRCLQCETETEAAKPACAACGLDPAKNKRHAGLIVELTLVHFDAPSGVKGQGVNHAACDPKKKVGAPGAAFTGEKAVVTCPKCKASPAFLGETPPALPSEAIRIANLEQQRADAARAAGGRVGANLPT